VHGAKTSSVSKYPDSTRHPLLHPKQMMSANFLLRPVRDPSPLPSFIQQPSHPPSLQLSYFL